MMLRKYQKNTGWQKEEKKKKTCEKTENNSFHFLPIHFNSYQPTLVRLALISAGRKQDAKEEKYKTTATTIANLKIMMMGLL